MRTRRTRIALATLTLATLAGIASPQAQYFKRKPDNHPWSLSDSSMDAVCESAFGSGYRLCSATRARAAA